MSKSSKLMRVHVSFADVVDSRYRANNGNISKVKITKELARAASGKGSGLDIDFWPIPKRIKLRKFT